MTIRPYTSADAEATATLMYETVHAVCAADYTPTQLAAWAPAMRDMDAWDASFSSHIALVAECDGVLVGFGDIDETGYLDRLYVHRAYLRHGVATALCDALERAVSVPTLTTHASITARPFFARRGYATVREQTVCCRGVEMTNFVMCRG